MTPREAMIHALERRPPVGRVPHFELVFFLTMEAFGRVHPNHRNYAQWLQMTGHERALHRADMADLFIKIAQRYEHNAIFLLTNPSTEEEDIRMIDLMRELSGDTYFLMLHGDATYEIPPGDKMVAWVSWVYENLDEAKRTADDKVNRMLEKAERLAKHGGLDGFALCSDYCYNDNPFLSPGVFAEVVAPYGKAVSRKNDLGLCVKHGRQHPCRRRSTGGRGPHTPCTRSIRAAWTSQVKRRFGGQSA